MNLEKLYKQIIETLQDESHGSLYYKIDELSEKDRWYATDIEGIKVLPCYMHKKESDMPKLIKNDSYIVKSYDSHGMDGGSCWGSEASGYHNEKPKDFSFDALATELCIKFCPDISFLKYKTLLEGCIFEYENYNYEYYGNYSVRKFLALDVKKFAQKLVSILNQGS